MIGSDLVLEVAHRNRHTLKVVRPEQDAELVVVNTTAVVRVGVENIQFVVAHPFESGSIGVVLRHKLAIFVDCECQGVEGLDRMTDGRKFRLHFKFVSLWREIGREALFAARV